MQLKVCVSLTFWFLMLQWASPYCQTRCTVMSDHMLSEYQKHRLMQRKAFFWCQENSPHTVNHPWPVQHLCFIISSRVKCERHFAPLSAELHQKTNKSTSASLSPIALDSYKLGSRCAGHLLIRGESAMLLSVVHEPHYGAINSYCIFVFNFTVINWPFPLMPTLCWDIQSVSVLYNGPALYMLQHLSDFWSIYYKEKNFDQ